MQRNTAIATGLIALAVVCAGCHRMSAGGWRAVHESAVASMPNPLPVPFYPRELVMDEVSDEVEDYFRILREQRIQLTGDILSEGYIDTEPKIGSTILEPWRKDSTPGFERMHATLQTVRRWARIRVIPTADQYLIDVKVYKELEDLEAPSQSLVNGLPFRKEDVLSNQLPGDVVDPPNRGWIPMGRDFSLEQKILVNLQGRFEQAAANGVRCRR